MNKHSIIDRVFKPVYGQPCWGAKSGYGSFLTMEFGEPSLVINEALKLGPDFSRTMQKRLNRRRIHVRGEWHLWIYCCEWRLYTGKKLVGDSALESSSKRRIIRAAKELDAQKLIQVEIDPSQGTSIFTFELDSRLETKPYDADSDQWFLYEPSGKVFSYRADGMYSHQRGNTLPERQRYRAFGSEGAV